MFNKPFVKRHKLLGPQQRTITPPTPAIGSGGQSRLLIGRLNQVQLGGFVLESPVVQFSRDTTGVLADSTFGGGIIGVGLLRRFRVIFDYARNQMILEPNQYFTEPFETTKSGLLLVVHQDKGKVFRVCGISENSPATEADLRKGDLIIEINGKPAMEFTLEEVHEKLDEEGREYRLSVKRDEQIVQITLKPRRLI